MPSADDVLRSIEASVEIIAGHAAAVDAEARFPHESLDALAADRAFGLMVPAERGGSGGELVHLAQACEALGAACASTAMIFLMHQVTAATIAAGGGAKAAAVLKDMAQGEALGTLAFSERIGGAHFYAPELKAVRNGDGSVVVNGKKSFVTSGGQADHFLVLVSSDQGADAYLLDKGAEGVSWEGSWRGLGMSGNSSIAMVLDQVHFDAGALVGAPGNAAELIFTVVAPVFLVGLAAVNVGIAQAAATAAGEHVKTRSYSPGGTLAEIQYIQHVVADMDIKTRMARLLVQEAAALADAGDPGALVPIMEAKVAATEVAQAVTGDAMTATGGRGYTPELPVERHLRDARAGAVMAPTNAVLRNWIGKALTGQPVP